MTRETISSRLATLFPRLDSTDARVALGVYRLLVGDAPVNPGSIAAESGEAEAHVRYLLNHWPGVFRDDQFNVIGFWGLARPEMGYKLRIAGQKRFAWCALDTLFLPELLNAEVRVEATTGLSGRPVQLTVSPDTVLREQPIDDELYVSFNLPTDEHWEDNIVSSFCHHVHFLYADEVAPWCDRNAGGAVLTLREAFSAGQSKNRHQFGSLVPAADIDVSSSTRQLRQA